MSTDDGKQDGEANAQPEVTHSVTPEGDRRTTKNEPANYNPDDPFRLIERSGDPVWWQAWANAFLVPVGIAALIIYGYQLSRMTDGINLTREMAQLDQRAWVAVGLVSGFPVENEPIEISVSIRNTGKTFAKNVTMYPVASIYPVEQDVDFETELEAIKKGDMRLQSKLLIPPGADSSTVLGDRNGKSISLTNEQSGKLKDGSTRLYVFGRITYEDIFGCQHWTTFCNFLQFRGEKWSWMGYSKHNDADNDRCP